MRHITDGLEEDIACAWTKAYAEDAARIRFYSLTCGMNLRRAKPENELTFVEKLFAGILIELAFQDLISDDLEFFNNQEGIT